MSDSVEKQLFDAAGDDDVSEVSSLLSDHPDIDVNFSNQDQWTALYVASGNGHVEVVKLLLAHPNIDVNVKHESGQTPFSLVCQKDKVSVVQVLLKASCRYHT